MGDNLTDGDIGKILSVANDLPFFKSGFGTRPSAFSAGDMNAIVQRINALSNGRINIQLTSATQNDGTPVQSAKWTVSDQNLIIDLFLNLQAGGTGGGSSVQLYQVTTAYTLGNQYVICGTATATGSNTYTNLGDGIKIALPFKLRTNTYNSPAIWPPYAVNDIIIATQPTGGTGVFVAGVDVLWQDVNFDKRQWQDYDYFTPKVVSTVIQVFSKYWTGTSVASGLDVSIAKPPELWTTTTSETIDANSWAYTYGAGSPFQYVARKAVATISGTAYTEYQVIVPRYLSTNIIRARIVPAGFNDGSSNPIYWQEESDRAWAAAIKQSGYES